MSIPRNYQFVLAVMIISLLWLNWYMFQNSVLGIIVGMLYLVWFGYLLGFRLFPEKRNLWKLWWGIFLLQSLIILIGAITYLVFNLKTPLPLILLTLIPIAITFLSNNHLRFNFRLEQPLFHSYSLIIFFVYIALASFAFSLLWNGATFEPVRGPWDALPQSFVLLFLVTTFSWITVLIISRSLIYIMTSSIVHFFLSSAVTLFVFPLGFGFDSFLHRAAESTILKEGIILPKTLYYLGQYSLVIHQHYLTLLPLEFLDKIFLPLLFSIFLPILILLVLSTVLEEQLTKVALLPAFFLFLPLTQFIQTTPQGLANLYVIITVFSYLIYTRDKTRKNLILLLFLTATTISIHPLSGIPLVLWLVALYSFFTIRKKLRSSISQKIVWTSIIVVLSLTVPFLFYISSKLGSALISNVRLPHILEFSLTKLWYIESFEYLKQFNIFFDSIYLYRYNFLSFFLIVSLIGWFIHKKERIIQGGDALILGFGIIWLNSTILKLFFSFENVIAYEQSDFPFRLFTVSLYFLIPFFLVTLYLLWKKVKAHRYSHILFIVIVSGIITSSIYITYPRYDAYELVRTYNTSRYDIEAVNFIEKQETSKNYIVLANQAVSAAAVKELGFKKYYKGNFFYPIPTGEPLYQVYLDMVYQEPSRAVAKKARDLTGVRTVYFVLNDYWFNAEMIKKEAMLAADEFHVIANDNITIFKYVF